MADIDIRSMSSASEAAREAGLYVSALLARYSTESVLLLLSGGSALSILSYITGDAVGEYLAVGVLDDRVTDQKQISNFLQMQQTQFFAYAADKNVTIFSSLPEEGESMAALADRLDTAYRGWHTDHPGGKIIITQGIGPDGHTAGILPHSDDPDNFRQTFLDTRRWIVGYDAGNRSPLRERITSTVTFLTDHVDESVLYACGEVKRNAIRNSLDPNGLLWDTPGTVINSMKHVTLFTDIAL